MSRPNSIPLGASSSTSNLLSDSSCVFSFHVLKRPPAAVSNSITASLHPVLAHDPARGLICHPLCLWGLKMEPFCYSQQKEDLLIFRFIIDLLCKKKFLAREKIAAIGDPWGNVCLCVCARTHTCTLNTEYFLYQSNKQRMNYLKCFFITLKMQQGTQPELWVGTSSITSLLLLSQRRE